MNDITGKLIEPGNVIAYPQRRGSSLWMNLALVISSGISPTNDWNDITAPYIRVIKIPQQRWHEYSGQQFKRTPRTSVVRSIENAVVVAPSIDHLNMPTEIQSNLRPYFAKHSLCKHLV